MNAANWTTADFRAWLAAHTHMAHVGYSDSVTGCPLAAWRRDLGESVAIGQPLIWVDTGHEEAMPAWVEQFVSELDARHMVAGEYLVEPVTARECLRVLGEVVA